MAPSAHLPSHLNGNGPARVGTDSSSPTTFPYPMQQMLPWPRQTPVPVPLPGLQNLPANGKPAIAPIVVSDVPGTSNSAIPLANETQKAQQFANEYASLCAVIDDCDPDVVRRVIRDKFEKCLLGSHYHTAVLMNIIMHQADEGTLQRAVRDFGSRIVSAGKHDLIHLMGKADLDEVADKIISKASNNFLDKALVYRLPTIQARRLVNALARAERLGYDAADIVENEHVIPSLPDSTPVTVTHQHGRARPLTSTPMQNVAPAPTHHPPQPLDSSKPMCQNCQRSFPGPTAYAHHTRKQVCAKPAAPVGPGGETYICPHCGQSFGGVGGLQYHTLNKVCGDFGEVIKGRITATTPSTGLNRPTKRPAPETTANHISSGSNSPAPPQYTSAPPATTQTPRAALPGTQPGSSRDVPLGTPQAKDMAHLTAHQIESLQVELRLAEETFKTKINDTQRAGGSPDRVQKKLTSLRNSYACKQSNIRKKYGIRLRQRRGREEMEHERVRMGIPDQIPHATETPTRDAHADKRVRTNGGSDATTTQSSRQETPIRIVAVNDMGNGLNGSNATVATEDPTLSMSRPPRASQGETSRPSSSYRQGNYRVEVHEPSPSKRPSSAAPDSTPGGNAPSRGPSNVFMTAEQLLRQTRAASGAPNDEEGDNSSSDESNTDGGD